jgi:hypothetical protein
MYQKLLTKAILNKMPKLYDTENIPVEEKEIIVKFFTPWTNCTWWITEGEEKDGDYIMFGLCDLGMGRSWGYVSMNELKSLKGPWGLKIERDMHFGNKKVKDLKEWTGG